MFPVTLDETDPCRPHVSVIEAFVERLDLGEAGVRAAEPAETGRPATIRAIC